MVKVIWHKAASLPHIDGSVVFTPALYLCCPLLSCLWISTTGRPGPATFPPQNGLHVWGTSPPSDTCFLGPTQVHIEWHLDWFSRFYRAQDCDRPRYSVTVGHIIYLVLRCGLIIIQHLYIPRIHILFILHQMPMPDGRALLPFIWLSNFSTQWQICTT